MELLTALGLAAPAGFNAPLTLLLVALASRCTGLVDLPEDYAALESWWAIGTLGVALVVEEVVDKIAGADHANDVAGTVIRPAAGALLMLAFTQGDLPDGLAVALGLLTAGSAHAAKAGARPFVSMGTAGTGNPVVSVVEDVLAVAAVAVALLAPVLVVLVLAALVVALVAVARRLRRRSRRPATPRD